MGTGAMVDIGVVESINAVGMLGSERLLGEGLEPF